jgi:hypothetical protein
LLAAYLAWGIAALLIARSNMESLWLPWLLVCPRLVSWRLLSTWTGLVILSGSISLLAMRPEWQLLVGTALAYRFYLTIRGEEKPKSQDSPVRPRAPEIAALALMGVAPFSLAAVIGIEHPAERPPGGLMTKQLTFNSYQLRVTGQPADIRMYWYSAFGDGRHHSLTSCMRFRGLILEPVTGQEEVMTGGNMWMRDFFIHEGKLKSSYGDYLLASFSPFASPGIHVILDAPADSMSAAYFSRASDELAAKLFGAYKQEGQARAENDRSIQLADGPESSE